MALPLFFHQGSWKGIPPPLSMKRERCLQGSGPTQHKVQDTFGWYNRVGMDRLCLNTLWSLGQPHPQDKALLDSKCELSSTYLSSCIENSATLRRIWCELFQAKDQLSRLQKDCVYAHDNMKRVKCIFLKALLHINLLGNLNYPSSLAILMTKGNTLVIVYLYLTHSKRAQLKCVKKQRL